MDKEMGGLSEEKIKELEIALCNRLTDAYGEWGFSNLLNANLNPGLVATMCSTAIANFCGRVFAQSACIFNRKEIQRQFFIENMKTIRQVFDHALKVFNDMPESELKEMLTEAKKDVGDKTNEGMH